MKCIAGKKLLLLTVGKRLVILAVPYIDLISVEMRKFKLGITDGTTK